MMNSLLCPLLNIIGYNISNILFYLKFQDHIVSAVLLTKRDTFLSRDEFNQLLYSSGVSSLAQNSFSGKPGQKVFVSTSEEGMLPIIPAILKPKPLWTGKQVSN